MLKRIMVAVFLISVMCLSNSAYAIQKYLIEAAVNDEWFIINGEKFQAQLYCLGWDEGHIVIFLEGSALGALVAIWQRSQVVFILVDVDQQRLGFAVDHFLGDH